MPDTQIEYPGQHPKLPEAKKRYKAVRECEFEKNYREESLKDLKYFSGEDQGWDEEGARNQLESEGRPAFTLNRISPIVRLICGAKPKTETKYSAVEEGDVDTAEIFVACDDHVDRVNRWNFMEKEWFKSGAILMRSVVEIMPGDKEEFDPRGEIELTVNDGREYYFDPASKQKDRRDGDYVFRVLAMDLDKAKETWPDHNQDFENLAGTVESSEGGTTSRDSREADEYQDPKANYFDKVTKHVNVVYYWYKKKEQGAAIIDLASPTDPIITTKENAKVVEEHLSKIRLGMPDGSIVPATERFRIIPKEYTRVKYLVYCADFVLEEGDNPWEREDGRPTLLSTQIPIVCFEPDRLFAGTKQELISLIKAFRDPQKYHNKLASAILEIIGTTAHSGWEYEEGAATPRWIDKLKKFSSKPGFFMQWARNALTLGKVRKIQPGNVPQTHMLTAKMMSQELLDISGIEGLVDTKQLGKSASGYAIDLKMRQGASAISWLYESFRFFQYLLAEYKRDAIQTVYNYEKVIRVKGLGTAPRYVNINQEQFDMSGNVAQVLNDITVGKYDVAIVEKPISETLRLERFKEFVNLVKTGAIQLPPPVMTKIVVHLMDDPGLKEIIENELGDYTQMAMAGGMPPAAQKGITR